jgi:hypothetical protein
MQRRLAPRVPAPWRAVCLLVLVPVLVFLLVMLTSLIAGACVEESLRSHH